MATTQEEKAEREGRIEWAQSSAAAGLGDLTVHEAVLGVMRSPFLQLLPDPLNPRDSDASWAQIGLEEGIIGMYMCQTGSTVIAIH